MGVDEPEPDEPTLLPEQRVGNAMREVRERTGLSLRSLAKQLGYHSHTTLSSYERGAVMPTDEVVAGYERILGLSPGALVEVLEQARIERHGDAWAKRRVHISPEFVTEQPAGITQPGESEAATALPRRARWRPGLWQFIAGGTALLGVVGLVVGLLVGLSTPAQPGISGVQDGKDPSTIGCAADGVTADSVNVYDPPEHLVGVLQLRGSARCGTSWPRFVPTTALAVKPTLTLELNVYRPADGAIAKYRVAYDGQAAYGNMLISSHQCVYAQVTLMQQGQPNLPPVQTGCRKSA